MQVRPGTEFTLNSNGGTKGGGGRPHDRHEERRNTGAPYDERRRDQKWKDKRGKINGGRPAANAFDEVDFKILYDEPVDFLEINYANWAYLQSNQMVSLRNYSNLKLIPASLIDSHEVILKVIHTVVKHHGSLHWERILDEFKRSTCVALSDHYEFEANELMAFLKQHPNMFEIDSSNGGAGNGVVRSLDFDEVAEFNV